MQHMGIQAGTTGALAWFNTPLPSPPPPLPPSPLLPAVGTSPASLSSTPADQPALEPGSGAVRCSEDRSAVGAQRAGPGLPPLCPRLHTHPGEGGRGTYMYMYISVNFCSLTTWKIYVCNRNDTVFIGWLSLLHVGSWGSVLPTGSDVPTAV